MCCSIMRRTQIPVLKRIWTPRRFEQGGGGSNPDYQHQTWRHMCKSVEFVVDSRPDSEDFSPAPLVFLPSQKPTL